MKRILIVTLILGALVISACMPVPTPTPAAAGIPNPASVNCIKQGGVLDIRKEANGEVGYCKFADGSECEEWALMRGECKSGQLAAPAAPAPQPTGKGLANPASVNCVKQGGTLDIRQDASGGEVGYCKFADGSECEEWAFFRGECAPGGVKAGASLLNPAS